MCIYEMIRKRIYSGQNAEVDPECRQAVPQETRERRQLWTGFMEAVPGEMSSSLA